MNSSISSLVNYYLEKNYIKEVDAIYCFNQICILINNYEYEYNSETKPNLYESLTKIIDYAVANNIIENYLYQKEILESHITNIFLDKPSIIQDNFDSKDIEDAYEHFYNMGIDSNYIKKNDLSKNIHFKHTVENKPIEISINLAKPEKDPKEIAKLKSVASTSYPKCPICFENMGYNGSINQSARSNHRVIEMKLNHQDWFFQYSPYLYYDFHCILIEKEHQDMKITDDTIKVQLDFIDRFKKFFVGNNACLSIVGGSILNHNHFQGGIYNFPINEAKTLYQTQSDGVLIEYLDWHLTTLKLTAKSKTDIINKANEIKDKWENYSDEDINILNKENNSLNFISRKTEEEYEICIILRNNNTSEEYPNGLFHTTPEYYHLKKENIGLIEAMGLAILPGRLVNELSDIKAFILDDKDISSSSHYEWAKELKAQYSREDLDTYINEKIAERFVDVLKCCNVLKFSNNPIETIKNIIN